MSLRVALCETAGHRHAAMQKSEQSITIPTFESLVLTMSRQKQLARTVDLLWQFGFMAPAATILLEHTLRQQPSWSVAQVYRS